MGDCLGPLRFGIFSLVFHLAIWLKGGKVLGRVTLSPSHGSQLGNWMFLSDNDNTSSCRLLGEVSCVFVIKLLILRHFFPPSSDT